MKKKMKNNKIMKKPKRKQKRHKQRRITKSHHHKKQNKPARKIKTQKSKKEKMITQTLVLTVEDLKKSSNIFRSYDIRGIYGQDLNEEIMYRIGNAFSTKTKKNIVVGMDVRTSSESLCSSFINGCIDAGKKVYFIGIVPLGAGMLHALQKKFDYAFITASHLPKEWNGVKFFHHDGIGYFEKENQSIRNTFLKNTIQSRRGGKVIKEKNKKIIDNYIDFFKIKAKKKMKIILDSGNGCAALAAKKMFEKVGFDVITIYDYLDGSFPNRDPEPTAENLTTNPTFSNIFFA